MAIVSGLKNIEALLDKPKGASGPKVRWLKLEDGQSVKLRFVNEVDEDSKFYDEDRGLAIVVSEHRVGWVDVGACLLGDCAVSSQQ